MALQEHLPLTLGQRCQRLLVHPSTISWLRSAIRAPSAVTAMIRARRSVLEGRRSARPALSRASTVDHHRGLVHVADLGELDLGPLPLQGVDQHAVHARREPDLGERRRHPGSQDMTGVVEQE